MTIRNLRSRSGRLGKGWVRLYSLFWICFTVGIVVAVGYGFAHPFGYPVEIHHRVSVWEQVAKDEWIVSSDEREPQRLERGRWKCCPDFDCSTVIQSGYIAYTLKYEERGTCKSIRANGLGWTWQAPGKKNWTNLRGEAVKEDGTPE
jgi:hypothetical protein